jgi:hypothetical protein
MAEFPFLIFTYPMEAMRTLLKVAKAFGRGISLTPNEGVIL